MMLLASPWGRIPTTPIDSRHESLKVTCMESSGNLSKAVRMNRRSFRRKSIAYPTSIVIEVTNQEEEKDKSKYTEERTSEKQVIRQKRKVKADVSLYIDIHNPPEDVRQSDTTLRNDSTVLKVLEPFYLSKSASEPRQQRIENNFNENEMACLFKGGFQVKALELLSLESSISEHERGEESSLGLATIQVTASLSAEISPLLKLIAPILAKHLKCPVEVLEKAGRKKEDIDQILSRLTALLSHKTILCDFSGIPTQYSSQSDKQYSSSLPSYPPPPPESYMHRHTSDSNPSFLSSEAPVPSIPERTVPKTTTYDFYYHLQPPPPPPTAEPRLHRR
ncbi:unnamed protein product [Hydatigera taeniaeformis]|uniref:E3 ubiquitin-protein ligase E3D n=1 Tax=Hydatigena taeniaeformis TaxID=6205 RepID=A0A0R3WJJ5_HYDTA|nr:unnamed protein product [Hydatigera taeniaeformis]